MQIYSAGFTGDRLFRNEMRTVISLELDGKNKKEIREIIYEQNPFQMKSFNAIKETLARVYRRVKHLDKPLKEFFLHSSRNDSLAILLYSFLSEFRLPREFVLDVVKYNFSHHKQTLTKGEILSFFDQKAEQSESVANWSEETTKKLKSRMIELIRECGLIEPQGDSWLITPIQISEDLKKYVDRRPDHQSLLTFILHK